MKPLEFNKELISQRQGNGPSVVFRKLADTGNEPRYQGSINTNGAALMKKLSPSCLTMQIVFSDQHSFIGFKPLNDDNGVKWVFGATQLFKKLKLVVGKKYALKVNGDIMVIDSNEYK